MKIAIVGYGKMGKTIEEIALERGHEIILKIGSKNKGDWLENSLEKVDVAIEFSQPTEVLSNIKRALEQRVPIVIGTTGWNDQKEEIQNLCRTQNACMLAASNFSIGVNLFFELNTKLAQMMSKRNEYNASIEETHHTQKLDSPSGTAISLANGIIENHSQYNNWQESSEVDSTSLPIVAYREEDVKGTHVINYDSDIDYIRIEHFAKNRKGFALGAVLAAEYIKGKTGIYTMKDVLNI